jgi:hypothetical protein
MNNSLELNMKQYISLSLQGLHEMLDDDNMGIPLEVYTDFLKSLEGAVFSTGYMIGLGYHPDLLEGLKVPLESLTLEELETLIEEALANG